MRGNGRIFARKGTAALWIAYYLRGKEYRESTGTTDEKKAAKFLVRRLKEVGADQIGARPFAGPQQERLTVNDLLDALKGDYELRGVANAQFKSHLKHVRKYFGLVRAVEVTAEMVDGYIKEKLGEEYKPANVNRGTQLLRQGFALAVERRHLNAIPSIRHLDEKDNVRQGFFEDWEFRAVESNLPDYLRDYSHFAYRTGWRKSSIANLRWEHYDGTSVRLPGKDWKNGEPQQVMLDADLADLIERR